jgi:hypothetical protein
MSFDFMVALVPSWQQHDNKPDGNSLFVVVAVPAIPFLLVTVAVVTVINGDLNNAETLNQNTKCSTIHILIPIPLLPHVVEFSPLQ